MKIHSSQLLSKSCILLRVSDVQGLVISLIRSYLERMWRSPLSQGPSAVRTELRPHYALDVQGVVITLMRSSSALVRHPGDLLLVSPD